jgi:hypothetical protein
MEQVVTLSETERVVVEIDNSNYDYTDIVGDCLGVISLRTARGYADIGQGTHNTQLVAIRDKFFHEPDKARRAIELYLSLAGQHSRFVALQGYSQSDWADVIIYGDGDWIEHSIPALSDWWKGDVYLLSLQTKKTYANVADLDDRIDQWETIECVAGITLSDDYTIEQAIGDSF